MRVTRAPRTRQPTGRRSDATVASFFAVTETLLSEKSFQDITVAEIISRTTHSRSSFYHHFDGKVDVLVALAASVLDDAYSGPGLWSVEPGRRRAFAMRASFAPTLRMWSTHGAVIGAVIEQMHTTPPVAHVWRATFDRFVDAVAEQISAERSIATAPSGPPSHMLATVLVCGIERTFYVSSRGLDARLPTAESAVDAIEWLTVTAIYGGARTPSTASVPKSGIDAPPVMTTAVAAPQNIAPPDTTARTILDALRSLLLESPLDKLSVARIAKAAGVSRSTFYFYFDNKNSAFAALYRGLADSTTTGLRRLRTIDRTDSDQIRRALSDWLRIDHHSVAIMRSALHEWPRRPELRLVYREGMSAMADTLESIITEDRLTGLAPGGPPAAQLTAVLLWTVERSVAGALAGEEHLADLNEVIPCLSKLLTSAIYRQ